MFLPSCDHFELQTFNMHRILFAQKYVISIEIWLEINWRIFFNSVLWLPLPVYQTSEQLTLKIVNNKLYVGAR